VLYLTGQICIPRYRPGLPLPLHPPKVINPLGKKNTAVLVAQHYPRFNYPFWSPSLTSNLRDSISGPPAASNPGLDCSSNRLHHLLHSFATPSRPSACRGPAHRALPSHLFSCLCHCPSVHFCMSGFPHVTSPGFPCRVQRAPKSNFFCVAIPRPATHQSQSPTPAHPATRSQ
jgi:hypothetical protein